MTISFHKYHGTGNDFIIVDNRDGRFNSLTTKQINFLCHRRFGVGADGLMLLNTLKGYDFEMKYFNSDGAESSMCGNGGRCLVQFAFDIGIQQAKYNFMAVDGQHDAVIDTNGWVKLHMKDVDGIEITDNDFVLNTGSPHYVKLVSDVAKTAVFAEGKKIRYSEPFHDQGINVNFVQPTNEGLYVRTYERGVEDETLSCGTGVTAAALAFSDNQTGFKRTSIQTPGGNLAVEYCRHSNGSFTDVWLCGPATFVFTGEVTL